MTAIMMVCRVVPIYGTEVWMHPTVESWHAAAKRATEVLDRYVGVVDHLECFADGSVLVVHPRESKLAAIVVPADACVAMTRGFIGKREL